MCSSNSQSHTLAFFYLIFWRGKFSEMHSFQRVSVDSPEILQKLCLSAKFYTRKLGAITIFYAVLANQQPLTVFLLYEFFCLIYSLLLEVKFVPLMPYFLDKN